MELDHRNHHFPRHRHSGDGGLVGLARNVLLGDDGVGGDPQHGRRNFPEHRVRNGSETAAQVHWRGRARLQHQRHVRLSHPHPVRLHLVVGSQGGDLLLHHSDVRHPVVLRHLLRHAVE